MPLVPSSNHDGYYVKNAQWSDKSLRDFEQDSHVLITRPRVERRTTVFTVADRSDDSLQSTPCHDHVDRFGLFCCEHLPGGKCVSVPVLSRLERSTVCQQVRHHRRHCDPCATVCDMVPGLHSRMPVVCSQIFGSAF